MISETERLAALLSYDILDTPPEPQFDDVVQLARTLCDTPVALVSLVSAGRQWFKAASGFDACETPIGQSVCAHAIREDEILVIPDLTADDRTRANTLVTEGPQIRFYAGAVLRTPAGVPLGALCVIDDKPRPGGLSETQRSGLLALARQTMSLLEYRRVLQNRNEAFDATARYAQSFVSAENAGGTGSFEIDIDTDMIQASPQFCAIFGLPDRRRFPSAEVEAIMFAEDSASTSNAATRGKGTTPLDVEYRIRRPTDGQVRWIARRGEFEHHADGRAVRFRGTVRDITKRKATEEAQATLNHELSHRIKNTLAMVDAIASQTLRHAADRLAVESFGKRIQALGSAHDILLQQSWLGAPLRDIMDGVLAKHAGRERILLEGADLMIGSRAVLSISLLLHELATNALKHGALSVPTGRVDVGWRVEPGRNGNPELVMTWRESGGPPTTAPSRKGFGTRLIQAGLAGTGVADLRFETLGLEATFRAPMALIAQEGGVANG